MVSSNIHTTYSAAVNEHDDDARYRYVSAKHGNRQHASDDRNADGVQTSSSTTSTADPREHWPEENISLPPIVHFSRVEYPRPPLVHHRTYELLVAQHPQTTAECGQNDMSRLPLSPPLFVRLVVRNSVGAEISVDAELPFLVARITLHSVGSELVHDQSSSTELYGTTISGPHSLRDLEGVPGAYFVFPDVGVRHQGKWRLYVSLLRIARVGSATVFGDGDVSSSLAGAWTDAFDVVSADGYVAPERTPLTRHFQSQGVRMYISSSVVPR